MPTTPLRVSIPVFPECDPSIVYGVFDTLWAAGRVRDMLQGRPAGQPLFEPRIVAATTDPLVLFTGVTIVPQAAAAAVETTDIVFVPNVMIDAAESLHRLDPTLVAWIARMHAGGAQLYAACGGSLVLAAAGLLDGLETTTHWAYAPLLRRAFPAVRVNQDRILVQAGEGHRIVCSGGASSWQDLSLLLIARHAGTAEALRISKVFLYQWHRDGQLPYASLLANTAHEDAAVGPLQTWLAENYERRDVLAEMQRRAALPKRTFDRRFKRATGYAPLAYVQALRIEEAKQLLETSDASVEAIAAEVGYADLPYFRRLFLRLTGMRPGDYRRKFQLPRLVAERSPPRRPAAAAGAEAGRGDAAAVPYPRVAPAVLAARPSRE